MKNVEGVTRDQENTYVLGVVDLVEALEKGGDPGLNLLLAQGTASRVHPDADGLPGGGKTRS